VARQYSIPTILLIHGTTIAGIRNRTIPEATARRLLNQFQNTNRLIVVARHLESFVQELGLKHAKVLENAIDVHAFRPGPKNKTLLKEFDIPEDCTIVTHISNLKPLKRPMDFLHAAKQALIRNPSLIFLIVGDGILKTSMEEQCIRMNLQNHVRFSGWVSYDRMPDFTNLSDIIVMPSETEARALVFLETQACGRVLIATDIPSSREVVEEGETGFLFGVGNIDDLTDRILFAANHPDLRIRIGDQSRQAALRRPLSGLLDDYDAAIREIVSQHQTI
jgi:glycosyltransferase involved in cell wall biosynthesis